MQTCNRHQLSTIYDRYGYFYTVTVAPQNDGTYAVAINEALYNGGDCTYYGTGTYDSWYGYISFEITRESYEDVVETCGGPETDDRGHWGFIYGRKNSKGKTVPTMDFDDWTVIAREPDGSALGVNTIWNQKIVNLTSAKTMTPDQKYNQWYAYIHKHFPQWG